MEYYGFNINELKTLQEIQEVYEQSMFLKCNIAKNRILKRLKKRTKHLNLIKDNHLLNELFKLNS